MRKPKSGETAVSDVPAHGEESRPPVAHEWRRHPALSRIWLGLVYSLYPVLGIPGVARLIARPLMVSLPDTPLSPPFVTTLVVLDGDNRRGRVREALRVLEAGSVKEVWVLGQSWVVEALVEAGTARTRIVHDTSATNTRDQMLRVRRLMVERRGGEAAIVASRLQMPRVAALADALGVEAALRPSPVDVEPPVEGWRQYLPTYYALRVSRDALYERAALAYYRWKGWI